MNELVIEVNAEKDHEMGVLRLSQKEKEDAESNRLVNSKMPANQDLQDSQAQEVPKSILRHSKRESSSEKEQRILRRKIQRLLLIRHCSTCPIPPPPLVKIPALPLSSRARDPPGYNAREDSVVPTSKLTCTICPVTSHCAEGKALCAHIKTCNRRDCTYKKCMTSREVLFHYKNCRDVSCEICGPVRALDRKHKTDDAVERQRSTRRKSDSSIETIDDIGWLQANMMDDEDR